MQNWSSGFKPNTKSWIVPNKLENTDFKSGFCGVKPEFSKKRIDALSTSNKTKLALYYSRCFLSNPAYINKSLPDTIRSFYSYYLTNRSHCYYLFDYLDWNEDTIETTLLSNYNWELAPDTNSSWRIGDGTAAIYNYIYYNIAGFSEHDTFRSNEIREDKKTREEALRKANDENKPRFESIKWYFDTINIDFAKAIKTINSVSKYYE